MNRSYCRAILLLIFRKDSVNAMMKADYFKIEIRPTKALMVVKL